VTTSRPRGRRPGHADTRSQIITAALQLFSDIGYDKISLRAIARAAEVDPALIHHYFASKAELFSEAVLALPLPEPTQMVAQILDGPSEGVGRRAAEALAETWEIPQARDRFTAMLKASVSEPGVHRPLTEFLAKEIYTKVAETLGHRDAPARGQLAVSTIAGFVLGRDILQLPALTRLSRSALIAALGRQLQAALVDEA
jgi:AcrR family transcriptional regulator